MSIAPVQAIQPLRETHLLAASRRAVIDHLDQLDQSLLHHQDALSQFARSWAAEFRQAAMSAGFSDEIKARFLALLHPLLRDSLLYQTDTGEVFFPPLDEEALLGSDGFVYGRRSLAIAIACLPEERRRRSPRNPGEMLSLRPHLTAQFLVQWLKQEEGYTTNSSIDQLYSNLFRHRPPFLPIQEDPAVERRKLQAEYQAMRSHAASAGNDVLSETLRVWVIQFGALLNEPQDLLTQAIASLKAALHELGDKPYLGSDGRVYGEMALAVHVSENSWPHTAQPHRFARHLVDWLWSKGYFVEEPRPIQERYQRLQEQNALQPIPTTAPERLERLRTIHRQRQLEQGRRHEELQAPLQQVRQHVQEVGRQVRDEAGQVNAQLLNELARIEAQIEQLRLSNEALREQIGRTARTLSDVERNIQETQVACNQMEQQLAEAKKDSMASIFALAGSIVATWLISQAVPGVSIRIVIPP